MRVERAFDPKKQFYAKRSFKMQGRDFKRGDKFPSRDVSNKNLLKFFQNGFIGYAEDFKDNKSSIKEVSLEKSEQTISETSSEKTDKEETKPKTSRRSRRSKKSQES